MCLHGIAAARAEADGSPPIITNISQLSQDFENLSARARIRAELTGTVFIGGSNETVVLIDGDSQPHVVKSKDGQALNRGQRVLLEGYCIREGTNLLTDSLPLIDNDGTHSMSAKSAGAWLEAGWQPIEVRYFNQLGDRGLEVSIEGPGLQPQTIPNSMLFHSEREPGLLYQCFEGEWLAMPDFNSLKPFKSGVISNFNIDVAGRETNYGVTFSGSIAIPSPGFYTFTCRSDDGSLVFLGNDLLTAKATGATNLPPLPICGAGQSLGANPASGEFCAALEGVVTFAAVDSGHLNIELSGGREHALLQMPNATGVVPPDLMGSRIRAAGICRATFTPDGDHVAGFLRVSGEEQIQILQSSQHLRPSALPGTEGGLPILTTIEQAKQMSREEAKRGYPVRVRGVITFVWPDAGFFLQDATWSIEVQMTPQISRDKPRIGDYWEVEGQTLAGFAPDIRATRAARLGLGVLPEPVRPNWGQWLDGSLDTEYVELEGIASSSDESSLSLLTRGGRLTVQLPELPQKKLAEVQGALVRIRGCLIPGRDPATQQVKLGSFALRNASLAIEEAAPADPFAMPSERTADLLLFESHASPIRRVRLHGVFLLQHDGVCYLMDGTNGLQISPKHAVDFHGGDLVDVVGFPNLDGPSPLLRDAEMRATASGPLPPPRTVSPTNLFGEEYDSTLAQIEAVLVSYRISEADQILQLRSGQRLWTARLPISAGKLPSIEPGSVLRLTGVYTAQGGDRAAGRPSESFELLLSSRAGVVVLRQPSWLTARHALVVAGALLATLLLASIWIWALKREVDQRTVELKVEIEDHKRTELELEEKTKMLTREIEQRAKMQVEIDRGHRELLITSRRAGMAEVATSVLHNVGNVLTSVNLLGTSIMDRVRDSKIASVTKLGELLKSNKPRLNEFLTSDERGRTVPGFVEHLGERLQQEHTELIGLVKSLNDSIDHINEIVSTQQAYAKISGVLETVAPAEVVEDALRMHGEALHRHGVEIVRKFTHTLAATMDRHKVLQILFNLLENAKHACMQTPEPDKRVVITVEPAAISRIRIVVADNGIGIQPENLPRIFDQGFSTRRDGHGFGLHSSVLAAQDMGGSLSAQSDGPGKGATFTLELPLTPPAAKHTANGS